MNIAQLLIVPSYHREVRRSSKPLRPESAKTLAWMIKQNTCVYFHELLAGTGLREEALSSALWQLENRGKISRKKVARGFYLYWALECDFSSNATGGRGTGKRAGFPGVDVAEAQRKAK